jgi:hypothetical protein
MLILVMDIDVDTELAPLSLAAARALFRAPQAEDACWADVHMPDGTVRARGRPEATNLGLCAEHPVELFGLAPPVGYRDSPRVRSTCSESLRVAISTGSHTGENGGA